jgi:hypothetical protein
MTAPRAAHATSFRLDRLRQRTRLLRSASHGQAHHDGHQDRTMAVNVPAATHSSLPEAAGEGQQLTDGQERIVVRLDGSASYFRVLLLAAPEARPNRSRFALTLPHLRKQTI